MDVLTHAKGTANCGLYCVLLVASMSLACNEDPCLYNNMICVYSQAEMRFILRMSYLEKDEFPVLRKRRLMNNFSGSQVTIHCLYVLSA